MTFVDKAVTFFTHPDKLNDKKMVKAIKNYEIEIKDLESVKSSQEDAVQLLMKKEK